MRLPIHMISIVVVNWNSGPLLERCIQSLLRNIRECEIIIVDNASDDSSLQFAANIKADMQILRNERNIGCAAGNNLGWHAAKGELILFLNPDTECFPDSIERLEKTLTENRSVWAVGGQLVNPSGQPQIRFNVRAFPTLRSVAADMLLLDEIWPGNPWTCLRRMPSSSSAPAVEVDQPAAACLMVSRTALDSLGGFDEAFKPAWFEDVDLCRRIRDHGGRIYFQPGARFLHHGGASLRRLSRQDFLIFFHTNQIRYFRKHHGARSASHVRRLIILGLFLRSALSWAYPMTPDVSRASAAKSFWNAARHTAKLRRDDA